MSEFEPDYFEAERGGWALAGICVGLVFWPIIFGLILWLT